MKDEDVEATAEEVAIWVPRKVAEFALVPKLNASATAVLGCEYNSRMQKGGGSAWVFHPNVDKTQQLITHKKWQAGGQFLPDSVEPRSALGRLGMSWARELGYPYIRTGSWLRAFQATGTSRLRMQLTHELYYTYIRIGVLEGGGREVVKSNKYRLEYLRVSSASGTYSNGGAQNLHVFLCSICRACVFGRGTQ